MKLQKPVVLSFMAIALLLLTFGVSAAQDNTVNMTITASEFKFDPSELNATVGTEVTFNVTNAGQFPHNVAFTAPDGTTTKLFPDNLTAGQSATGKFTFTAAGDWKLFCPVGNHAERGMVGTVHVAAAAGGQSATGSSGTQAAATSTPATLPTTGGTDSLVWAIGAGLLLLGAGLWFRRSATVRG